MKIFIILMCFFILLISGCDEIDIEKIHTSDPNQNNHTIIDDTVTDKESEATHTPQPKISSSFENAPNKEQILQETNKEVSKVLLQDTLTYTMPINEYFAVCLEEDASEGYRWLLASDDGPFEYVEETHINGYRVFIIKTVIAGETSILFELTQNSTLVETLSYQLIFS